MSLAYQTKLKIKRIKKKKKDKTLKIWTQCEVDNCQFS